MRNGDPSGKFCGLRMCLCRFPYPPGSPRDDPGRGILPPFYPRSAGPFSHHHHRCPREKTPRRVLKRGGRLLFTTSIHNAEPAIAFNAHRIYNHDIIRDLCTRLNCLEEKFYSHQIKNYCPRDKITTDRKGWDVYCGCWEKKS